jgi:CHAT domain-containing protein
MSRRVTALLLAAALSACTNGDGPLQRLYEATRLNILKGSLSQALTQIDEGEAQANRSAPEWATAFRLLRAEVFLLRLDASSALAILNTPFPPPQKLRFLVPRRTQLLAQAQTAERKLSDAIATLAVARQEAVAASADDVILDVDALHGQVLLRAGKWDEGETVLQDVLSRASASKDAFHQALALHNLGISRLVRNRFDGALAFFARVLELKELETYTVYGTALSNAGVSYARLGEFDTAAALQIRAVESHRKRGERLFLEQSLGELGNTYIIKGDANQGISHLKQALEVATEAKLTADAAVWAGNLAEATADRGSFDEAETYNNEAIRLKTLSKRSTLYNTLNAGQIAVGRGRLADAAALYGDALAQAGTDPAVQWEARAGLARTAFAAGDLRAAARHFDAALSTIQQTRSSLSRTEYRLTFLNRVIRFYQDYVDTLVASDETGRALEVADSSRGIVLGERMGGAQTQAVGSTTAFVAAAKRAKSVWLSYWLAPGRSYVWLVTATGVHSATLPGAAQIEKLVEQYRQTIEHSSTDPLATPNSAGDALYKTLVAPVAQFIPPGSSVRIVPDGALHGINFETLPVDGPRRHYWIEDVTVAIAPSLGLLASAATTTRQQPPDPGSLLLVGNPTPRVRQFPRLRYAPIEMRAVSSHFATRTARFDGDRASPKDYLAAAPERFSVIHFTAHAEANRTSPLDSAVILAGVAGTDKLYARDVAERALRANLVTISACRSAGERAYAGEGLIGFSWAFLRAGARQVIAGLWDVDDQSTATLMDNLYAGIARGDAPPTALRAAKLALMQQGGNVARPYYWGPFEVFTVTP